MKLPRPHIPLSVKLLVAQRQLLKQYDLELWNTLSRLPQEQSLNVTLTILFGKDAKLHLDHDPPLMLRTQHDGEYIPEANDPEHLVWRTAEEHRIKTYVKGDGAQLSDAAKRRKEVKRAKKEMGCKQKYNWPSRKIPSRPMQRRRTP